MSLLVTGAGFLTTVQDRGRPGHAHLGVPCAGALDGPAADLANRLVGNDPADAVLEATSAGLSFVVRRAMTVAVTGAPCDVSVSGRASAFAEPVSIAAGSEVRVGPARHGVRSYVAVSGGIVVSPVLGSRSTDTLAQVGPPVVVVGAELPVGERSASPVGVHTGRLPRATGVLGLVPGPRHDWFADDALALLGSATYLVGQDSNRIGLRLSGSVLLRTRHEELPSEGMVLGAVQVPPDGQPVVFLHDHPVTGGYPVIGVVPVEDLWQCAQLRPGDQVRFSVRGG